MSELNAILKNDHAVIFKDNGNLKSAVLVRLCVRQTQSKRVDLSEMRIVKTRLLLLFRMLR